MLGQERGALSLDDKIDFFLLKNQCYYRCSMSNGVFWVAHRGFADNFAENSADALRGATQAGADAIEVDVRVTRDTVPVLLHDETLLRTLGVDQRIDRLTYEQVDRSVCNATCALPTLRDALQVTSAPLILDIKVTDDDAALRAILETCSDDLHRCWLQSSCVKTLHWFEANIGRARRKGNVLALMDGSQCEEQRRQLCEFVGSRGAEHIRYGVNVEFGALHTKQCSSMRLQIGRIADDHPLQRCCWTLNDERHARLAYECGYRAFICDNLACVAWQLDGGDTTPQEQIGVLF